MSFLNKLPEIEYHKPYSDKLWEWMESLPAEAPNDVKQNARIYASNAFCHRYNFLNQSVGYAQETAPLYLDMYAKVGSALEMSLKEAVQRHNSLLSDQFRIAYLPEDPPLNVGGLADLIIKDHNGDITLLEIKTTARINDTDKAKGKLSLGPEPKHVTQVLIYAAFTGIRNAHIIYISRAIQEKFGGVSKYIYTADTSDENLHRVIKDLYYSQLCMEADYTPDIPEGFQKSVECKHCVFKDVCYKDLGHTEDNEELMLKASQMADVFMGNIEKRFAVTKGALGYV